MDEDLLRLWQLPTRTLGPALKGAFQTLWLAASCEPNHIVITAAWLGQACGAEPRTAWGWIQQLAARGLLDIVDRDERRGTIQVYLYRPTAIMGPANHPAEDRQAMLPLAYGPVEGVGGLRAETPERSGVYAGGSGVCAQKPPSNFDEHTSYPRTYAGAHAVESRRVETCRVDVGTSATEMNQARAGEPVTEAEAAEAVDALRQIGRRWKDAGLRPARDPDQRAEDASLIRRAHVLVQRGLIPESVLAEAVARPIDLRRQGRRVRKPAAVMTKRLFSHPGFRDLVSLVRERLPPRAEPAAVDGGLPPPEAGRPATAWEPLPRAVLKPTRYTPADVGDAPGPED